jgi:leucyl-tRNA---protein transferase
LSPDYHLRVPEYPPQFLLSAWPALPPPARVHLTVCNETPCVYLPGRLAQLRAFAADRLDPEIYRKFMDANFRRSGEIIYQPICRGCRECVQIRVPAERFVPGKSQRRCLRRNADLRSSVTGLQLTDEKFDLYQRYCAARHGQEEKDRAGLEQFLYHSPVATVEIEHRDQAGKLLAVGVCDVSPVSLSSVYFYFDPAESRRGLGTYGALVEIELARNVGIPFYYLGYWVAGSKTMDYKRHFRPYELLGNDGEWRDGEP